MSVFNHVSLLFAEDDALDVRIMERILKDMNFNGSYKHMAFGQDVIDWTLKQNEYSDSDHPTPNLIILDIGLPGVTGLDVLETLRSEETTKQIPVLLCSGSSSQRDYHKSIALGANAYIQKNAEIKDFSRTCQLFIEGWSYLSRQKFY